MVPPALSEVGQDVLEGVLEELEPNAEEPRDVEVAEHEHLEDPTKHMGDHELIEKDALHSRRLARPTRKIYKLVHEPKYWQKGHEDRQACRGGSPRHTSAQEGAGRASRQYSGKHRGPSQATRKIVAMQ